MLVFPADPEHVHAGGGVRGESDARVHPRDAEEDAGEAGHQSRQGTGQICHTYLGF